MNILIINGKSGIGNALVDSLSKKEPNVLYTTKEILDKDNPNEIHWNYDGEDTVVALFNLLKNRIDNLDAVVNCLGSIFLKPGHMTSVQDFDKTLDLNLRSSFLILKQSIPLMRKNGGNILFFSTAASSIGLQNHEAISAAKAGVEGLVKSAAATYAKNNIRINAVALGLVETKLSSSLVKNIAGLEISKKMHSLSRIGTTSNITEIVEPLILSKDLWMTGSIVNLDGGLSTTKLSG